MTDPLNRLTDSQPNGAKPVRGTCSVADCPTLATAKGMCAKHRMRQLRTGDPEKVRRPGRRCDGNRAVVLAIMDDAFSPRGFQRYWTVRRLLIALGAFEDAHSRFTRPNGSINVAAMEREAARAVFKYVRELDGADENAP